MYPQVTKLTLQWEHKLWSQTPGMEARHSPLMRPDIVLSQAQKSHKTMY